MGRDRQKLKPGRPRKTGSTLYTKTWKIDRRLYDSQRRSATGFSQQHWPTVSSTRAELRESVKAQLTVVHLLNKMIDDSTPGCLAFAWIRHCPDPLTRTPDMTSSTTSPCSSFSVRCAALSRSPYFHRLSAERRCVIIIPRHSTVIRAVVFHDLESVTRRRGKLPSLSPSSGCCLLYGCVSLPSAVAR